MCPSLARNNASRTAVGFLALLTSGLAAHAQRPTGASLLVRYVSSLDDSTQEYGVYLPASPAPSPGGHPAVLHMHGYGWWVGAGFSDWQTQWADEHGWVLINLNARGPQFYEGVGDVETRNVVRDAHRRYGLDLDRLYVTGGSMGGSGAFRHGVRYPDIFAAAVGVDGWADFREWHWHWYARTDARDEIEEFRRPLLEACSPLYWAGRGRWGHIEAQVSGQDDIVLPRNGLDLYNALLTASHELPGAYEARLHLDSGAGHGGSSRLDRAYDYFAAHARVAAPPSFRLESTVLVHGAAYWGGLDRFTVQGLRGALESATRNDVVSVTTENLDAFALYLEASPAAGQDTVQVNADGFPCYAGVPATVHFVADRGPQGELWGWRQQELSGLRKTRELEGGVGEAFKVPFVVVYGAAGSSAQTDRHRREAEAFAAGWNGFMIHADTVRALPEDDLAPADLAGKSLVLFGAEDTSRLLQRANAACRLPVHVRSTGVTVEDPVYGDREYLGAHFGAFLCYPNPLTDFRTYLVVCQGQWGTQPGGGTPQGLEYDLEKLPWAYGDYVVFNTDQAQLAHVPNVNNKPPVTCYEAGYFVEAGDFDQEWRPCRSLTLDRVIAGGLPTRRIHVDDTAYAPEDEPPAVVVCVVDRAGAPVPQARVTVRLGGAAPVVRSGVSGPDGVARFPATPEQRRQVAPARVVNVEATGAVYDFRADRVTDAAAAGLGLVVRVVGPDEAGVARLVAEVSDRAATPRPIVLRAVVPAGTVTPALAALPARMAAEASFAWDTGGLPPGPYACQVTAQTEGGLATRTVLVPVAEGSPSGLRLQEVKATDIATGSPYSVSARLLNLSANQPATAEVVCSLLGARRYLPPRTVTLPPGAEATVTWTAAPGEEPLSKGLQALRVVVRGHRGVTATGEFMVR